MDQNVLQIFVPAVNEIGFLANNNSVVLVRPNIGHMCCTMSLSGVQSGLNVVTKKVLSRFVGVAEGTGGGE